MSQDLLGNIQSDTFQAAEEGRNPGNQLGSGQGSSNVQPSETQSIWQQSASVAPVPARD